MVIYTLRNSLRGAQRRRPFAECGGEGVGRGGVSASSGSLKRANDSHWSETSSRRPATHGAAQGEGEVLEVTAGSGRGVHSAPRLALRWFRYTEVLLLILLCILSISAVRVI
ncbi:hypothetical protein E2C01_011277 [Portunus trituberculatus]|uniref:Uncharacterized protein n=1 Tax=Portunus trituberculatus TaxID=210409 RepID=A0A5B7DAV8_PORTR|nr:hypothetical protein [Portunus trituberculatus]